MEITALTKVGALLEAHPWLEEPLIGFVPAFEKLRNPILKATVAKLATLEQAAKMGNVPLPELLGFLRKSLGQDGGDTLPAAPIDAAPASWPAWYRAEAVIEELDASAMLASGNHPLAAVKRILGSKPPGSIVLLLSEFEPAPLLEQMRREGILVACIQEGTRFKTCLRRP